MTLLIPKHASDWIDVPDNQLMKAAPEGTRWITVHPNGKDEKGVPIMIKESSGDPGSYYVVGGAGGKMNHLKLTGVKSKEEAAADQKQKQAEKRAKKKADDKELAASGMLDKKKAMDAAVDAAAMDKESQRVKAYVAQVLPLLGKDPSAYAFNMTDAELEKMGLEPGGAGHKMLEFHYYRKIETQINKSIEEQKRRMLDDEVARSKAGVSDFALGRKHKSTDVDQAYAGVDRLDGNMEELDRQRDEAAAMGDEDTVAILDAQKEAAEEERGQYQQIIDDSATPTVDELTGKKTKSGKGYDPQAKPRAIQAMVESGDLDPDKLRRDATNDKRPQEVIDRIAGIGSEGGLKVAQKDMAQREDLLNEAAELAAEGDHDGAYSRWKKAEAITTKWDIRVSKAENRDPESKMSPADYLDLVADKVEEGRANMAAISVASKAGYTATPDDLRKAQADYDQLQKLMATKKKFDAMKANMAKKKEQIKGAGTEAGYVVDQGTLDDKFHVDQLSDEAAMASAAEMIEAERQATWNTALLNEVEDSSELSTQLDLSKSQLQRAMAQHVSAGAFGAFGNATMMAAGDVLLDRPVVDAFGIKGAASILAAHLRETLDPDQFEALTEGLGAYHGETSADMARDAFERAQESYDEARGIAFGSQGDTSDPIGMQYLNDQRRAVLESTLQDLGSTIGGLRAQAELLSALKKGKPKDQQYAIGLPMGATQIDSVIQQMAAMGLSRDDYHIAQDPETKTNNLFLQNSALSKIVRSDLSQDEIHMAADAHAIKTGRNDEAGWLPNGVAKRPKSTFEGPDPEPVKFAIQPDFTSKSGAELEEHTEDYIGSRVADGWPIETVLGDMRSASFQSKHLTHDMFAATPGATQTAEVEAAIRKNIPTLDIANLTPETVNKFESDREAAAQRLAEQFRTKNGLSADSLHTQGIGDQKAAIEATHRALAADPASVLAFKAQMDLTPQDKGALRQAFWKQYAETHNISREESLESKKAGAAQQEEAKQKQAERAKPSGMESMFGEGDVDENNDPILTTKYGPDDTIEVDIGGGKKRVVNALAHQAERREAMFGGSRDMYGADTGKNGDMGAGADELHARSAWDNYLQAHGDNPDRAYQSVQEGLRGSFNERFAKHYGKISGRALKQSRVPLTSATAHHVGFSHPDQFQERFDDMQTPLATERANVGRGGGGKFIPGSRSEKATKNIEARAQAQGSMFQEEEAEKGESAPMRTTLGERAEGMIASVVNEAAPRWSPKSDPVSLFPVSMGDDSEKGQKFYKQQRAIKLIDQQQRVGLWLGAGSGKSLTTIGAYTHLNGQGKVRRALFAVPSVVQKQFGGEGVRYLDPATERADGRHGYKWHAESGASKAEREKAYRDGSTDFMVLTHQGITLDTIGAIAEHRGMDEKAVGDWFNELPREERAKVVKEAHDHKGWHGFDMLYVDEAHYISNRQGKANSTMANVMDAIGDNMKYHVLGSGTPVKNDPSEAFDMLSKLDPKRFNDRASFMRQYGGGLGSSKQALQRLTARYFYQDRVESGVEARPIKNQLKLSPVQRKKYNEVQDAFNELKNERIDAKKGKREINPEILVRSMRLLSPNSFANIPEEEHVAKATNLLSAAGTIKDAAFNRIVNAGSFEDNAKMQHVAQLAAQYREQGKAGVVFARNLETISELRRGLEGQGHRVAVISGSMTGDEKSKARLAFNPDVPEEEKAAKATADILICSDAGNTGLNLQRGKWLAHIDTPQTSNVKEQRDARINRLGQTQNVDIHEMITDTPFDGTAQRRLERKAITSHVFQDPSHNLDDTGLAAHVNAAYRRINGQGRMVGKAVGVDRSQARQAAGEATRSAQSEAKRKRRSAKAGKAAVPQFHGGESAKEAARSIAASIKGQVPTQHWNEISSYMREAIGKRGSLTPDEWGQHLSAVAQQLHGEIGDMFNG